MRDTEATMRRSVHAEPVCDFCRYEGFVLAIESQFACADVRLRQCCGKVQRLQRKRTERIEGLHTHSLGLSEGIIVEVNGVRCVAIHPIHAIHWDRLRGSFKALQTLGLRGN